MNEAKERLRNITRSNHGTEYASPLKGENNNVQPKEYGLLRCKAVQSGRTRELQVLAKRC
jgi:hypothetical protein